MKRSIVALVTCLFLLLPMSTMAKPVESGGIGPLAVEMCVTIFENTNAGGDHWTVCGLPNGLKNANLAGDTTGLIGGCNKGVGTNPDWNDCVSSVRAETLPANYAVHFYYNSNYGVHLFCIDANGTTLLNTDGFYNDTISSWRVLGGNCA